MKKLSFLIISAALLVGCSGKESTTTAQTTQATTEVIQDLTTEAVQDIGTLSEEYEGATFDLPKEWSTAIKDNQLYIYPDDKSLIVVYHDPEVIESFGSDALDKLVETVELEEDDVTTKMISETPNGYTYAKVGGFKDYEEGEFWVYMDYILTPKGSYVISLFNDLSYNDTDHLYDVKVDAVVRSLKVEE